MYRRYASVRTVPNTPLACCMANDRRDRQPIDIVHHTVDRARCLSMAVDGHRRLCKLSIHNHKNLSTENYCSSYIHLHQLSVTIAFPEGLPKTADLTRMIMLGNIIYRCTLPRTTTYSSVFVFAEFLAARNAVNRYTLSATI